MLIQEKKNSWIYFSSELPLLGFMATAASREEEGARGGWWLANRRRWENGAKNSTEFLWVFLVAVNHPAAAAATAGMERKIARLEVTQRGRSTIHRVREQKKQILRAGDGWAEKTKIPSTGGTGACPWNLQKSWRALRQRAAWRCCPAAILPPILKLLPSQNTQTRRHASSHSLKHTDGGRDAAA